MTNIIEARRKESMRSTWKYAKKLRRIFGWVLTFFIIASFIALFRGMIEPGFPGWAFYKWG